MGKLKHLLPKRHEANSNELLYSLKQHNYLKLYQLLDKTRKIKFEEKDKQTSPIQVKKIEPITTHFSLIFLRICPVENDEITVQTAETKEIIPCADSLTFKD